MRIPLLSTPDKPLISSTQELVPVVDIEDGVVLYRNGGAALVLESTSLNFSLLSENEQEAVIAAYAGLLNSFKFPVQIVVSSRTKDIGKYIKQLDEAKTKVKIDKLKTLLQDYQSYIKESIKKRNVLSKSFYIVVLFTPYELGLAKSLSASFQSSSNQKPLKYPKSYVMRKAKISLFPKRDHLMRQAQRMGVKLRPLSNDEMLKLFYNLYNPEPPVKELKGI